MKTWNYRLAIFIVTTLIGIVLAIPSFLQLDKGPKINLGLDLQGGMYLLLGVQLDEAVTVKVKSVASSVKHYADKEDILLDGITTDHTTITVTILDKEDQAKMKTFLANNQGFAMVQEGNHFSLTMNEAEIAATKEFAANQAVETIRNRLDQFGLAEPTVAKVGTDKIHIELPGIKTVADEQRARELIAKSAHLEMRTVDEAKAGGIATMSEEQASALGDTILPDYKDPKVRYLVKEIPLLDGNQLADARVAYDQNNQPVINFTLNAEGADIFGDFTGKNVGTRLAIVLDGKIYSAPVIRERIGGGSGQISGSFTVQEASDLAIALRSGALSAPVSVLEKRSVGPSLGADSIQASMIALASGGFLVIFFMIVYYGYAGVIATTAMFVNIILIVSIMALFGATLTLPGMAGIVLTVGMAVDANVIINERIRELLRKGIEVKRAIHGGYDNALSTLVDANLTTLISAVALYAYGTGPIKGFAVTLAVGILVSMLTAILGTHGLFEALMPRIEKSKNVKRWFGLSVDPVTKG